MGSLIMSVSGVRGTVDDVLTPLICARLAYIQTRQCGQETIIIGRDTRPTGELIQQAICRGVHAAGGSPVSIGIAPTPTTCVAVDAFGACGGVIITASHNPLPYNGYKMVHGSGRLFSAEECARVYEAFRAGEYPSDDELMAASPEADRTLDAVEPHIDRILAAVDAELIRGAGLRVAVDSINGAAGVIFPLLLDELGVTWQGVNNGLDGNFVHNPEPRPEHLRELAALLAKSEGFCAGFAFDPDADRLATMGERGQPISEEMTLALAMENVLARTATTVATNLSTSMTIDDVARSYGVKVLRTKIGEANVVEAVRKNGCTIGGEGNGGVIFPAVSTVRDGLVGLALVLELIAQRSEPLSALASRWNSYPIVKEKIELGSHDPARTIEKLVDAFSRENIDTQDGVKIIRDYGWVHVRPSNTEPILRCYAEAQTQELARELADMVIAHIDLQSS